MDTPKYAVLKWDDWRALRNAACEQDIAFNWPEDMPDRLLVSDAEVIRAQDVTAAPLFHMYANLVQTFRDLMTNHISDANDDNLSRIADHFHQAGVEADALRASGGTKLPD